MFGPRLTKFKIKKFKKEIEPQEILLDSLAQKREREFGIPEQRLETPLSQKILRGLWLGFLIFILIFFGKTAQLQIFEGETLSQLSEENRFVIRFIQAQRGVIYDRNMEQLVFNKPSFDLICRPLELPDNETERKEVFKGVSKILNKDYEELEEEIMSSSLAEISIAKNLDHQTLILFEARSYEFPGFEVKNNTAREYVSGPVFAHLIGYQRKTGEKMGLEEYYDDLLLAEPGEVQIKRDVYGSPISKEIVSTPESGQSLVLYLDSQLQQKLSESLSGIIKRVGAKSGAAVAIDPRTGGVLAMFSFPSFDNNLFSQGMSQEQWEAIDTNPNNPLFNRVISGEYPTGSTIKPLIASAGLEENLISPTKSILCKGLIEVEHRYDPEIIYKFHDWTTHGWTNVTQAIAKSCNVFFYRLGGGYEDQEGLGPSKIKKYLNLFGWGKPTKIDIDGEAEGLVPDPAWKKEAIGEPWWDGNTYYLSIGQEYLLATPIQVAAAFSAIANKGILYEPHIVKKVLGGETVQPKIVRKNFIKQENLEIVRQGMREGVIYGSSVLLNSLPIEAASKTGTAQTWQDDVYHNWVTVFAPYENPEIVLTVLIENVKGMQSAALPVAQDALSWYFSR